MKVSARALHFVFKIGDRTSTAEFYRNILGMKILRHEEFNEGCDAQCNGAYNNRWSKTMVGYGPEDNHFVVELTYNYPVKSYKRGDDFLGLTIQSSEALNRAKEAGLLQDGVVRAPDGYPFSIVDKTQPRDRDPVVKVALASSNLAQTIAYWNGLLSFEISEQTEGKVVFKTGDGNQALLEFQDIGKKVDHAEAYGRIAFAIPAAQLAPLQEHMDAAGQKILTRLISLDTPGKATVSVVILADPDDHEICFVGDEGFRELSQVDPRTNEELDKCIKADKS